MKPSIPSITRADIENPERVDQLAHELLRLEYFRTLPEAQTFMASLRKHRGYALEREYAPRTTQAVNEEFRAILEHSWDRIHSGYGTDGRLKPAIAKDPTQRLPLQLYEAAFQRVQSGRAENFEDALAAVCAENLAPLPQRIRAFEALSEVEPELLAAEERAAGALAEARAQLAAVRAQAVGIINTRDLLTDKVTNLKAELTELRTKRDLVTKRRERSAAHVVRSLRPGATLMLHTIADLGASVFGFELALQEVARLIPEKERELATAEKELADFLASHADALAPV